MLRILAAMAMLAQASTPAAAPPAASPSPTQTIYVDFRFPVPARRHPLPYETAHGLLLVRGTVAGRPAWILLDTGAGRTLVDTGLARGAGLRLDTAPIAIRTPSGALAGNRVAELDIAIADQLAVRLSQAGAADLRPISTLLDRPVEAVLGWDVLGRIAILVDPRGPALSFSASGLLPPPAGATWLPLTGRGRIPVGVGKTEVSLFLDLGSNHVLSLRTDVWDRLAPAGAGTRPFNVTHARGEGRTERLGTLPEIAFGRGTIRDIATVIETGERDGDEGHVGTGLLARFAFMLDAGQGRFWYLLVTPAAPAPAPGPGVGR